MTVEPDPRRGLRAGSRTRARRLERLWLWSPVALAAIYAIELLRHLSAVVSAVYTEADTVSGLYIGQLYPQAPGSAHVVLGDIPWYSELWFEELTRWLPGHRTIWEMAGWILTLVGIGLVAWVIGRIAGRWSAMIVAVSLGCAGAALLPLQFAWSIHAVSYVHVCVLGAFAVALVLESGLIGGRTTIHACVSALVALVTAAGVASDRLVIVAGLVPFAIAGAAAAWMLETRPARRVLATTAAVTTGSAVLAAVLDAIMRAQHVTPYPFGITFAPFDRLLDQTGLLIQSIAVLMNGDFGGASISLTSVLALAAATATVVGACAAVSHCRLVIPRALARPDRSAARDARAVARVAHLSYWFASGLLVSLAFVVSTLAVNIEAKRYVVTVAYAMVAIVAVAAHSVRWCQALVTGGACTLVAASSLAMYNGNIQAENEALPSGALATQLNHWAQAENLAYGYAGYLDAAPLSWETGTRVKLYPVTTCDGAARLCPFSLHQISSWYRPKPGTHSFLLVDPSLAGASPPTGPPASLGRPLSVASIGRLTAYVYGYDIASRFAVTQDR